VYTSEILKNRLNHLTEVYPKNTLHAIAIKSNSHQAVLSEIIKNGCGLEAASFEEVILAIEAGCSAEKIVFDSPVKTVTEIEDCNKNFKGIVLNANCFEELERLKGKQNIKVGIRINPLIDLDNPGIYDVSSSNSKFGIPISDREEIVKYALAMDNCFGLHIHAGSEIGSQENHIQAIASIVDIAETIRSKGKKLGFIDIGGGIPAKMEEGLQLGLYSFYQALLAISPKIQDYQIITEYGRFVQAHTAFTISKVEYLLTHCKPNIALIHVGADLFPREIYSSHPPHHEIYVLDKSGKLKTGIRKHYDIGGPLCFSGDFVKRNIELPEIEPGDFVCIADTGANTLSMWSRHCSRKEINFEIV
jgi:diaminopimelate decarboxylase